MPTYILIYTKTNNNNIYTEQHDAKTEAMYPKNYHEITGHWQLLYSHPLIHHHNQPASSSMAELQPTVLHLYFFFKFQNNTIQHKTYKC